MHYKRLIEDQWPDYEADLGGYDMLLKRLTHEKGLIFLVKPADHAAGVDGDSFNFAKFHHASIMLLFGAITGDAILKVYSGATDAAKTTALTFKYRQANGDHGASDADQFQAEASSSALTLTAATYDNRQLVVEIEEAMVTGDGENFITLELSSAASTLFVSGEALLSPRYSGLDVPTAIP